MVALQAQSCAEKRSEDLFVAMFPSDGVAGEAGEAGHGRAGTASALGARRTRRHAIDVSVSTIYR